MQYVEFTAEEAEILHEVLEHGMTEIDMEVFRTDTHDFKTMLKHRREVLERVMAKLAAAPTAASRG